MPNERSKNLRRSSLKQSSRWSAASYLQSYQKGSDDRPTPQHVFDYLHQIHRFDLDVPASAGERKGRSVFYKETERPGAGVELSGGMDEPTLLSIEGISHRRLTRRPRPAEQKSCWPASRLRRSSVVSRVRATRRGDRSPKDALYFLTPSGRHRSQQSLPYGSMAAQTHQIG